MSKVVLAAIAAFLILGVVVPIVLIGSLGAIGLYIASAVQANPAVVDAAADRIADFTLPPGYRPEATASFGGIVFVSYAPGDGHSHIQLAQGTSNGSVTEAALEGYVRDALQESGAPAANRSKAVRSQRATIRGQSVTLVVGEGINHDGEPFRTLSGFFAGRAGPAFLSVESPVSTWNQPAVDQFIASIR